MITAPFACLRAVLPLFLTALSCSVAGADLPAAKADPPSKELQQQLIHAVVQNQVEAVQTLLARGGDPNARIAPAKEDAWALEHTSSDDPAPPLIVLACRFGSPDPKVIRQLIAKGADVNLADKNGITPLMAASELDWDPSIVLLLERGAEVSAKDRSGKTALMVAMGNRGLGAAAKLLEKGADINAHDKSGWTPLMYAVVRAAQDPVILFGEDTVRKGKEAKERYLELIAFLLAHKADVNAGDKAGNTPLKLAQAQRQTEVVQQLRQAGARPEAK